MGTLCPWQPEGSMYVCVCMWVCMMCACVCVGRWVCMMCACVCVCVHVSGVRVCGEMHIKYGKYSLNVLLECNDFHASYKVHIITSIAHTYT